MEIDFLAHPKSKSKWIPHCWGDCHAWQVLSGEWRIMLPQGVVYRHDPSIRHGENISIVGSLHWHTFKLRVRFKFLTDSSKPPEGGAIVYFLFRDLKNYYSFHFCLEKQKVELIKRRDGVWSVIGEREFRFAKGEDYSAEIVTHGDVHECRINGLCILAVRDYDFSRGRIGLGVKYCDLELNKISLSLASDS